MRKSFLLVLLCLLCGTAKASEWDQDWSDCSDLSLPLFQARMHTFKDMLRQGVSWELSVNGELTSVDKITNQTCKEWAANPNGDEPLRTFISQYSDASRTALALKSKADDLLIPTLEKLQKQEKAELSPYGYKFETFPCGKAFARAQNHVRAQIQAIELRFETLRQKCPTAADGAIAEVRSRGLSSHAQAKGDGGPSGSAHSKVLPSRNSDVTGSAKAIQGDNLGRNILEREK